MSDLFLSELKYELVLASGSPRRRELLQGLGRAFRIIVPDVDEAVHPGEAPAALCARLAEEKARAVAESPGCENSLVIAADTIVVVDGLILGKPADGADGLRMLGRLQGRSHEVLTGVSVRWKDRHLSAVERTVVTFRALSSMDMEAYAATGEGLDKAGAYAIQGRGALIVESIDGDYFNVVGLPLCRLGKMLEELGPDLWEYRR